MHHRPFHALVIDNDADERYLIEMAFGKALNGRGTVFGVKSGNEGIKYLAGEGDYQDRKTHPFPDLILTDLKMTDGDGFEVLEFIKSNPGWSIIPRIVFSCSDDPDDIRTAYLLGASAFHQKPISLDKLRECIEMLVNYWTSCVRPPRDESGRLGETGHGGKLGSRFPFPQVGDRMRRPGGGN